MSVSYKVADSPVELRDLAELEMVDDLVEVGEVKLRVDLFELAGVGG